MPSPRKTGGPIVKTGPTMNQTRSRNKNGQWRKSGAMRELLEVQELNRL